MKGEWVYFKKYFTKDFCDKVIKLALEVPATESTLGFNSAKTDSSIRRSKLRWLDPKNPKFQFIFDAYWQVALKANREWFKFNVLDLPPLQFTEYDSSYQGEYKSHQDVFWINPTQNHRKLSMIIQLTDDTTYTGGDLELENVGEMPNKADVRTQGTALLFPSFIYHKLTPVITGKRYSLVGWFEGPKFV